MEGQGLLPDVPRRREAVNLSRADGHTHQGKLHPAKEHYSDNTVALFIPKGFRDTGRVDVVVNLNGCRKSSPQHSNSALARPVAGGSLD